MSAANISATQGSTPILPAWASQCHSQLSVSFDRAQFPAPSPNHHGGDTVENSHRSFARKHRGEHSAHTRGVDTGECQDWLRSNSNAYHSKEISALTGAGTRAAENIKQGRNGITMAHLVAWCRNDPSFRAEFFKFCGGHLEGEPEMVAALSHAINAVLQRRT